MRALAAMSLAICLCSATARAHDGARMVNKGPVTLVWNSDRLIPSAVVTAMEDEVEHAFSPAQIDLSFEPASDNLPQISGQTVVLRFVGDCAAGMPVTAGRRLRSRRKPELGVTHIVDGKILPFADVDCTEVRAIVGNGGTADPTRRNRVLGRALGRVVAHELFHMLTRDTTHGRDGLAAASFSRADLIAPRRSFAERDLARIAPPRNSAKPATREATACSGAPDSVALGFVAPDHSCR